MRDPTIGGEDAEQGGYRDLHHAVVRLARGQPLELEAWDQQHAGQRVIGVASAELEQLVGDARQHRHEHHPRGEPGQEVHRAERGEEHQRHEQDHEHEAGAAARVRDREGADVGNVERGAGLPGMNRLVFGAVVTEHATHVRQVADRMHVGDEEAEPD